jgi:hypothetical protein
MENNKAFDKIKKLLLKANSTDSPHEAETFLLKAHKLMMKFKIDKSEFDKANGVDEPILFNQVKIFEVSLEGVWETDLLATISRSQGCDMCWLGNVADVYGEKHDVEMSIYFFTQARNAFRNLSRIEYLNRKKTVMDRYPHCDRKLLEKLKYLPYRNVFIRSFLYGAVIGLSRKLHQTKMDESDESQQYAILVKTQLEKVGNYLSEHVKPKMQKAQGSFGDSEAVRKGMETGQNHNLSIGLDSVNETKENGKVLS